MVSGHLLKHSLDLLPLLFSGGRGHVNPAGGGVGGEGGREGGGGGVGEGEGGDHGQGGEAPVLVPVQRLHVILVKLLLAPENTISLKFSNKYIIVR